MSNYQMLVSPSGKLYMMYKGNLLWSYQGKYAYKLKKPKEPSSYMDAYVKEDGSAVLYHQKYRLKESKARQVPVSWDLVEDYVKKEMTGSKTLTKKSEKVIKLGRNGEKYNEKFKKYFVIRKAKHTVKAWQWRLSYSTYTVKYVDNKSFIDNIKVLLHYSFDSFQKTCLRLNIQEEKEVEMDVWVSKIIQDDVCITMDRAGRIGDEVYYSESTGVYTGEVGGHKTAVKLFPREYRFSKACQQLWSSQISRYILPFRGLQMVDGHYRVAFERCKCNLYDFSADESRLKVSGQIFRSLLEGLMAMHMKGISHLNLNPWNIMIAYKVEDVSVRISGFGSFVIDGDGTYQEKDRRDLAKLVIFCHERTGGSIQTEKAYLEDTRTEDICRANMYEWAGGAKDFASLLLDMSIPLEYLTEHSFIWQDEKKCIFYEDSNEHSKNLSSQDLQLLKNEMLRLKDEFFECEDWESQIPQLVVDSMKNFAAQKNKNKTKPSSKLAYDPKQPIELLRFIRNSLVHYVGVSKYVKDANPPQQDALLFIGCSRTALERSYSEKFPFFLAGLHKFLRRWIPEATLKDSPLHSYYSFPT